MSAMVIGLVLMSIGCREKDSDTGSSDEVLYEETLLWDDIQDMESWQQARDGGDCSSNQCMVISCRFG